MQTIDLIGRPAGVEFDAEIVAFLLGNRLEPIKNPVAYRDSPTAGIIKSLASWAGKSATR